MKVLPLLIFILYNSIRLTGQVPAYLKKVDKKVGEINTKLSSKCYKLEFKNGEFITEPLSGTGELTIYKCEGKNFKMEERLNTDYGYRTRIFYVVHSKLKFVDENHFEFEWDEKTNKPNFTMVRKIYSAKYYVEKDFYHSGEMNYMPDYRHKVNAPEPMTYVLELVAKAREYESKKK
jgi:hypothetical protein